MKKRDMLRLCNLVLSGFLALLGFSACDEWNGRTEYGSPHADYEIKGKVIDKETRTGISGVSVIVRNLRFESDSEALKYYSDTLKVNASGEYVFNKSGFSGKIKYRVVAKELDTENPVYKPDSLVIEMDEPSGGKGWYEGTSKKENVDIQLEKNEQ